MNLNWPAKRDVRQAKKDDKFLTNPVQMWKRASGWPQSKTHFARLYLPQLRSPAFFCQKIGRRRC